MKKHFLYASTAALLALSFASCVDNDEPRGLRELRYAKANEWNANAENTRAKTYGDSLLSVYKAQEQDLLNKSQELANLYTQATNEMDIEEKRCSLAVVKAQLDVKLAEEKYNLAAADPRGDSTVAAAQAGLAKAQLALAQAQNDLNTWNAYATYRKDTLANAIKAAEAELAAKVLETQKTVDRNVLAQKKWAAELKALTYEANLENLLIVAAANKNVWVKDSSEVWDAYKNLIVKQDSMFVKQIELYNAQQALLIAINKYDEDSAKYHKELNDSINDAKYELDWATKKVTLAKNVLDDFKENSQANKEKWTEQFNKYKTAIDALAVEIDEYDVQIADATAELKADSLKYKNKKEEIEKPLKAYNDKKVYYNFVLDGKIAGDTAFANQFPKPSKFSLKQGVIANDSAIKNSDLNAQLDAILNVIGDDDKNSGTFYYKASDIKLSNVAIAGYQKDTADLYNALDEKIDGYNAKIDEKTSDINTMNQKLDEFKALTNTKKKYEEQKDIFEAAVIAYKDAALAYEFSEENGKKSDLYERFADELAEAIKDFNVAYQAELDKGSDGDAFGTAMIKKRKDIQLLAKTGSATNNTDKYWDLRKEFDGTTQYKDVKDENAEKFWNFGTNLSASFGTTAWENTGDEVKDNFDKYVKVDNTADIKDEDIDKLVDVILSGNNYSVAANVGNKRVKGNDKGDDFNAYQKYVDAATDFMGSADRYLVYTEEEIKSLKAATDQTKYESLKTTYDYWKWVFAIADLEKDIREAQSYPDKWTKADETSDPTHKEGEYKNPGIKEYKELIAKAKEETAEDVAKKEAKIDSVKTKINNSPLWEKLYGEIKAVKDSNDAEIKRLTIAQQEAYKTELTAFETKIVNGNKKVDDLQLKQNIAISDTTYKATAMKAYKKLVLQNTDTAASAPDARFGNADIAAEIIIDYTIINLQFAVDQAKEEEAQKKMELDNAQKHLDDFEAGERDANRNNYFATITDKSKAVKAAELEYEYAVKEYNVAEQYYNEILAGVEEEE